MAMTARPRRHGVSRSRTGGGDTCEWCSLPVFDGRFPVRSPPRRRASPRSRFSITDGGRVVLAACGDVADRGPEVPVSGVAGSPASGRPMVRGTPIWLPSGQHRHREMTGVHVHRDDVPHPGLVQGHLARWPVFSRRRRGSALRAGWRDAAQEDDYAVSAACARRQPGLALARRAFLPRTGQPGRPTSANPGAHPPHAARQRRRPAREAGCTGHRRALRPRERLGDRPQRARQAPPGSGASLLAGRRSAARTPEPSTPGVRAPPWP